MSEFGSLLRMVCLSSLTKPEVYVAHILSKLLGLAKSTQINSSATTSLSLSLSLSDSVSDQLVENGDAANWERGHKGGFRGGFLWIQNTY